MICAAMKNRGAGGSSGKTLNLAARSPRAGRNRRLESEPTTEHADASNPAPRRRNPDSNSSAAPTATAPAETTADPSTATPARRVAEALDKAVEGLGAAFENFERDLRARGMRP